MNTELSGILVLVAFSVSFFGIVIWAAWPSNKTKLESQALIPFLDEDADGATETHHV